MFYRTCIITADADLVAFQEGYEKNTRLRSNDDLHCRVSLDYLRQVRVFGCKDAKGTVLGGYVIGNGPIYRAVNAIPESHRSVVPGPISTVSELICIWRDERMSGLWFKLVTWPGIIYNCLRHGRQRILGIGFKNKMSQVYAVGSPEILYSGPSASAETDTSVQIFAYTRAGLLGTYVGNFWIRLLRDPITACFKRLRRHP